jgi:O-antigen biosynthesis protein
MQSDVRSFLKRNLPPAVKTAFQRVRDAVAPPPVDDIVLAEYRATRDDKPVPRLSLVLPLLQRGSDFGGTATGIDIFCRLYLALSAQRPIDLRILVTDVVAETDTSIIVTCAAKAGLDIAPQQIELVQGPLAAIAVRADEIFMPYNWWVTLNFAHLRDQQAALFGNAPKPLVWLMQDYEPAFMAFSSGHMLARAAYDTCGPLWGVINSSNLARYIEAQGHEPDRRFVFEPVIVDALRPYLDRVASSTRKHRVLVYGRPTVERNCFPALVRGLRRWVRDYPEFADWEVISAGVAHDPIDLGNGRKLTSVGKLSLDDYAQMLLSCSAGVSLMASPHPSYPPLEMAHFGLRTVTNSYLCKDLTTFHPNILSVPSIAEAELASALADACHRSASPPEAFLNPDYVRADPYPFMAELAEALGSVLAPVTG